MNILNLLLHIGAAAETGEEAVKMIEDLLSKQPLGPDAVKFLQDLSGLVGDAIFPLPAPLTVDIAEEIIAQIVSVISPVASAFLKKV